MRPGYLSGYGEDHTRPGNQGESDNYALESDYIPEYMRYSKVFPNFPTIWADRPIAIRDPRTFNVLLV